MENLIDAMALLLYEKNNKKLKKLMEEFNKNHDSDEVEQLKKDSKLTENGEKCRNAFIKLKFMTPILKSFKFHNNEEDINTFCDELINIAEELRGKKS